MGILEIICSMAQAIVSRYLRLVECRRVADYKFALCCQHVNCYIQWYNEGTFI